jgi:hypothetical protein
MEHIKFVWDIVVFVAEFKIVKAMLTHIGHIPADVVSAVAWVGGAVLLWVLHAYVYRKTKSIQDSSSGALATVPTMLPSSPNTFDATDWFNRAYLSPLYPESEQNIRTMAQQNQPNDKEGFYVKFLTVGLLAFYYDTIWWNIFRSQLLALQELNHHSGILPVAEIKNFYDKAVIENPTAYAGFSFEQWLNYMTSELLLIRHASEMIEITKRGKDFLGYITHWGKDMNTKTL